jgi:uncharacterized protein DUF4953
MITKFALRSATFGLFALAVTSFSGCVADRPSRNGVFNENQYLRKSFIIRPGDDTSPDNGWLLKATIVSASEPNVFGDGALFGLYAGSHSSGDLFHFVVTSDHLQMVSNREISSDPTVGRTGDVMNAWPATNVDLKYRVNLDGEKTNFYEENQELDWEVRQWVKVLFDKNDLADLQPLGSFFNENIAHCADLANSSATLYPESFFVDETNDYMEWTIQVTLPINWTSDCVEAFGPMGDEAARLGRDTETVNLKYSMVRATGTPTYQPLVVGEFDPILRKYGPILFNTVARDTANTGLLGGNSYVVRFDPTKPINWYFEQGFPSQYMPYFTSNASVLSAATPPVQPIAGITTIEDATNKLLAASGAGAQVSFHQYNEPFQQLDGTTAPLNRQFGDVRFNMLRWVESMDQQATFAGVTGGTIDPRTGEQVSADIVFDNFAIKDLYVERINAYLEGVGASAGDAFDQTPWPDPPLDANGNPIACASSTDVGKGVPIVPTTVQFNHNGNSTLFSKMQGYLYKPSAQYGPLGPQDFILKHVDGQGNPDADFYNAYFAYLPYVVFANPALNPWVTPEGGTANTPGDQSATMWQMIQNEAQLHQLEGQIDRGTAPFDVNDIANGEASALNFLDQYKALTVNHHALQYALKQLPYMPGAGRPVAFQDTADAFSMVAAVQRDARHCVQDANGIHWESKGDWVNNLVTTYWTQVFWHEFGHAMGLDHNFMASVDQPNFPKPVGTNADGTPRYPLYASSVMEYNAPVDRIFWTAGWGPYDQGAISWIYANANGKNTPTPPPAGATAKGISGQITSTYPWIDPAGFDPTGTTETQFLYCNARHEKNTPLCREGDLGITPSEITANEIDSYEWQYKWRNFRQYRKIWSEANYGDVPMNTVTELRRFLSLWSYDMSQSELTQRFQQIGVTPPAGATSAQFYYDQLTRKFDDEMAHAGELSAAFHEAIVQQSAGARPYVTVFDNYTGAVTQQGISLDKLDAIQSFAALWQVDNYDETQSAGQYISSYAEFGTTFYADQVAIGSIYSTVAEQALQSMLGGSFDAFYYFKPLAAGEFTRDTHTPQYLGSNASPARAEAGEWAGGYTFYRLEDFLDFFKDIAQQNNFKVTSPVGGINIDCTGPDITTCNYDPRTSRAYPEDTYFSDAYNRFLGPDGRRWIWVYLQDRNEWMACDQDRNVATYVSMYSYTSDVIFGHDASSTAYNLALQLKYMLDYYDQALQITQ